ncbi:MAG TPA: translation elongation factor Ts [Gammaproteobacteria bacterium]|nr:translation elongation factor Ts [Gammaproteobacteria bacterium]
MAITASLVKELRERTGAGMMECKKALVETNGDLDAAIEMMRKSGLAKADKKAGRVAAEGQVVIAANDNQAAIVEVNCETDFVAGGDDFAAFATNVAEAVLAKQPADLDALNDVEVNGNTVDGVRRELIAKIGENISVRRFTLVPVEGDLGRYLHGVKIGVVVDLIGGDSDLARDIAMHIAASKPVCVSADDVPADIIDKERDIFRAQALESGKPADIVEKMIEGRIRKYLGEITLLGQPFVKDPDTSVEKLLKAQGASVRRFVRYEVGEGVEKKQENFAEEVAAQAKAAK